MTDEATFAVGAFGVEAWKTVGFGLGELKG